MKHTRTLLTLLLAPLAALPAAEGAGRSVSTPQVRLAENGVARHAIVIQAAETATAAERFAAEELALFLKKITGAAFSIVKEGEHTGPGIYVGHTRRAAKAGVDLAALGDEDWVLLTAGEDLILTGGRPRGALYAVYEFLDSTAGCRWIAPDIEIAPSNRDFAVPALERRGRPAFSWRETSLYPRHDDPKRISKEDYARFLVRNRYNGSGFWLDEPRFGFSVRFGRPGSSHTFHTYQEKWQDVKPEFFAMTEDGKRAPRPDGPLGHDFCLTNAELKERVARQLLQYIEEDRAEAARKGAPPPRLYAFSQNDTSSKYCRCPECSAIAQREGSYAGTTLAFVNDIAARISEKYPDVRLLTEAGDKPYFETPAALIRWLNSEFYTQVNAWLDEAEALCQGEANAKHLRHVQLERVPVDSGMLHLWHRYATSPAWKGRKEEVLRRYEMNKRLLIQTWATTVHAWVNNGAGAIDGELAALRLEPPARFAGRNANLRLVGTGAPPAHLVKDASAAGGQARRLGSGKPEDHKLPFQIKVHDDVAPRTWGALTLDQVPQSDRRAASIDPEIKSVA